MYLTFSMKAIETTIKMNEDYEYTNAYWVGIPITWLPPSYDKNRYSIDVFWNEDRAYLQIIDTGKCGKRAMVMDEETIAHFLGDSESDSDSDSE